MSSKRPHDDVVPTPLPKRAAPPAVRMLTLETTADGIIGRSAWAMALISGETFEAFMTRAQQKRAAMLHPVPRAHLQLVVIDEDGDLLDIGDEQDWTDTVDFKTDIQGFMVVTDRPVFGSMVAREYRTAERQRKVCERESSVQGDSGATRVDSPLPNVPGGSGQNPSPQDIQYRGNTVVEGENAVDEQSTGDQPDSVTGRESTPPSNVTAPPTSPTEVSPKQGRDPSTQNEGEAHNTPGDGRFDWTDVGRLPQEPADAFHHTPTPPPDPSANARDGHDVVEEEGDRYCDDGYRAGEDHDGEEEDDDTHDIDGVEIETDPNEEAMALIGQITEKMPTLTRLNEENVREFCQLFNIAVDKFQPDAPTQFIGIKKGSLTWIQTFRMWWRLRHEETFLGSHWPIGGQNGTEMGLGKTREQLAMFVFGLAYNALVQDIKEPDLGTRPHVPTDAKPGSKCKKWPAETLGFCCPCETRTHAVASRPGCTVVMAPKGLLPAWMTELDKLVDEASLGNLKRLVGMRPIFAVAHNESISKLQGLWIGFSSVADDFRAEPLTFADWYRANHPERSSPPALGRADEDETRRHVLSSLKSGWKQAGLEVPQLEYPDSSRLFVLTTTHSVPTQFQERSQTIFVPDMPPTTVACKQTGDADGICVPKCAKKQTKTHSVRGPNPSRTAGINVARIVQDEAHTNTSMGTVVNLFERQWTAQLAADLAPPAQWLLTGTPMDPIPTNLLQPFLRHVRGIYDAFADTPLSDLDAGRVDKAIEADKALFQQFRNPKKTADIDKLHRMHTKHTMPVLRQWFGSTTMLMKGEDLWNDLPLLPLPDLTIDPPITLRHEPDDFEWIKARADLTKSLRAARKDAEAERERQSRRRPHDDTVREATKVYNASRRILTAGTVSTWLGREMERAQDNGEVGTFNTAALKEKGWQNHPNTCPWAEQTDEILRTSAIMRHIVRYAQEHDQIKTVHTDPEGKRFVQRDPLVLFVTLDAVGLALQIVLRAKLPHFRIGHYSSASPNRAELIERLQFRGTIDSHGELRYIEPIDILILNTKVGSVGLTLTQSNRAYWVDFQSDGARYRQANKRLHRCGQKRAVTIVRFQHRGGPDRGWWAGLEQADLRTQETLHATNAKGRDEDDRQPEPTGENLDLTSGWGTDEPPTFDATGLDENFWRSVWNESAFELS